MTATRPDPIEQARDAHHRLGYFEAIEVTEDGKVADVEQAYEIVTEAIKLLTDAAVTLFLMKHGGTH